MALNNYGKALGQLAIESVKGSVKGFAMGIKGAAMNEMPGLTALMGLSREVKSRADKLGEASAVDASVKEQRTNNIISLEMVRQLRSINNNVLQQTRISSLQANNAKQTAMFAEEQEREKAQRDKELLDAIKGLKGGGAAGAKNPLGSAGAGGGKGFLGSLFDALQSASLLETIAGLVGAGALYKGGKTIFGRGGAGVPTTGGNVPTTGGGGKAPTGSGAPPTTGGGKVIPFPPGGRGGTPPTVPPTGGGGGLMRGGIGLAARGLLRFIPYFGLALLAAEIGYEAYKIFGAQGGQGDPKPPKPGGAGGSSTTPIVEGVGGAAFGIYAKPGMALKGAFNTARDSQAASAAMAGSAQKSGRGPYAVGDPVKRPADVESTAKFITGKEDFRGLAYNDGAKFAIGYGHNITDAEIKSGQIDLGNGEFIKVSGDRGRTTTATREQANKLYSKDIAKFERVVIRAIGQEAYDKLSQNQKTAILSYAYNTGKVPDGFAKAIKDGNLAQAAASIRNGIATSGGVPLRGLKNRRAEEAKLFDTAGPATSEERKDGVFAKAGGPGAPINPAGGGGNEMETQNSIYKPTISSNITSGSMTRSLAVGPIKVSDDKANEILAEQLKVSRSVAKATVVVGGQTATERLKETQAKENKDKKYLKDANQTFLNQFQSTTQRLLSETLYKAIVVGAYGKEGSRNLVSKQEASGEGYRGGQLSNLLKLPSKTEKILTSAFGKKLGQAYAPMISQLGTAYLEVGARQAGRGLFKGLFGTDDASADSLTGQILGNFAKGNKQAATEQLLYGLTGVASGPETIFAKYGFNSSQQGTNFLGAYGAAQITAPLAGMMDGKQPTYTGPYGKGTYGAGQTPMIQPMQPANQRGAYYTATTATGQEKTFINPAYAKLAIEGDATARKHLEATGAVEENTFKQLDQTEKNFKEAKQNLIQTDAKTDEYRIAERVMQQAELAHSEKQTDILAKIAQKPAGGGSSAGGNFMSNMGNFAFDLGTSLVANKLTQNIKNPYLKAFANYGIASASNSFIKEMIFGAPTTVPTLAAGGTTTALTGSQGVSLGGSFFQSGGPGVAGTAGNMLTNAGYTTSGSFFSGVQGGMNSAFSGPQGFHSFTGVEAANPGAFAAGELFGEVLPYAQAIVYALQGDYKKAATTAAGTYAGMKAGAEIGAFIPGVGPVIGAAVGAVLGSILGSSIGRKQKPAVLRVTSTSGNEVSAVTAWEKDKPPEAYTKFADVLLIALLNSAKLMQQQSGVTLPFINIGIYVDSVSGVSLWLYQEGEPAKDSTPPKWSKNFGSIKDFKLGTAIVGMIEYMRDCLKEGKDTITADKLDKATLDLKTKDITTITSGVLNELKPGGQYDLAKGVGYNSGTTATTGSKIGEPLKIRLADGSIVANPNAGSASAAGTPAITPSGTNTSASSLTASSSAQTTTLNNGAPVNSVVAVGGKTENDNSTTVNNFNQMSPMNDLWRQPAYNTSFQLTA